MLYNSLDALAPGNRQATTSKETENVKTKSLGAKSSRIESLDSLRRFRFTSVEGNPSERYE